MNAIQLTQPQFDQLPSGELLLQIKGVPEGYEVYGGDNDFAYSRDIYCHHRVIAFPYSLNTPLWVQEEWKISRVEWQSRIHSAKHRSKKNSYCVYVNYLSNPFYLKYWLDYRPEINKDWQPAHKMPKAFSRTTLEIKEILEVVEVDGEYYWRVTCKVI